MKRNVSCAAVSVAIVLAAACGGKQSMASKSAQAYRDAVARGIPVAAGGHGGHMATQTDGSSGMAGMDMTQNDRSGEPAAVANADQSNMAGMNMKGKDRSNMAGMDMKGTDRSNMAGMQHGGEQMGGMGRMNMAGNIPPGGLWGGLTPKQRGAAGGATAMSAAPGTSGELSQRSSTLSADPQDAPSPLSVAEAVKASAPMAGMRDTPAMSSMPGMQMNQTRAKETDLYVCPAHPDDTSPHPGAAKCGMQRVRKNKK